MPKFRDRMREPQMSTGMLVDIARPVTIHELLDLYAEAAGNSEAEVALKLRYLINGRISKIETWLMGSSVAREAIHGRSTS